MCSCHIKGGDEPTIRRLRILSKSCQHPTHCNQHDKLLHCKWGKVCIVTITTSFYIVNEEKVCIVTNTTSFYTVNEEKVCIVTITRSFFIVNEEKVCSQALLLIVNFQPIVFLHKDSVNVWQGLQLNNFVQFSKTLLEIFLVHKSILGFKYETLEKYNCWSDAKFPISFQVCRSFSFVALAGKGGRQPFFSRHLKVV